MNLSRSLARFPRLAWAPWLVLVAGLGITFAVWQAARTGNHARQQERFDLRVSEIVGDIEARMRTYEQTLHGTVGLFAASDRVERESFKAYVDSLDLARNHPGIQGVGYAERVAPGDTAAHERRVRAEGFPDYRLHPNGPRDVYSAIVYLEPFDWRNRRAFGYDMYAEPVRRAAMDRAWETGAGAVSGKVTLLQETGREVQAGVLMYVPVYRNEVPHDTPALRRANLVGWAYAPFRMNDLMQGLLHRHYEEEQGSLALEIFDGVDLSPEARLYGNGPARLAGRAAAFTATKQIAIGGHVWTVAIRSLPSPQSLRSERRLLVILVAGGMGSLMLTMILWQLLHGRGQALKLAEAMNRDRGEAVDALRRTLAELDDLYDHAPCGYHSLDGEGRIARINRTELDWLGYSREEVLGRPFAELITPASRTLFEANYPQFKECGHVRDLEYELVRKDGSTLDILLSATAVYDPDGGYVMSRSTLYDNTARKQSELELAQLNRFYGLLSHVNEAIVRVRDDGQLFAEVCRLAVVEGGMAMAWVGMLDAGSDEVRPVAQAGRDEGYLEFLAANGVFRHNGPTARAIRENSHYINHDTVNNPVMGPWRDQALRRGFLSSAAFPLRREGVPVGVLSLYAGMAGGFSEEIVVLFRRLVDDVSFALDYIDHDQRRRLAELELARLNEALEQRVAERTRMLEAANKELEAFSYSVSHDLRAPLRSIDGFSQILGRKLGDQLDATGKDYLLRIQRASQRMGELIDDLLKLARVSRAELKKENMDLSRIAHEVVEELQARAPARRVEVAIEDGVMAQADGRLIRGVLENLLGNAWKFTARQEAPMIAFGRCEMDGRRVCFVRDNGAGFDMQYANKLFGAFQRLHKTEDFEGTGVGLATVQRIINRHGGRVWAESAVGEGATFYFTLD